MPMSERINDFGQPIGPRVENWAPRALPSDEPMVGRYCRLEKINPDHAPVLYAAYREARDWRDWTYLLRDPFETEAAYISWAEESATLRDPLHFSVIVDGKPLGTLAHMRIDPNNGVIEVGDIRFARALQRTPAATEAVYLMMRRAFDELGYRRHEWKCDALHEKSRRAAERFGFTYEGLFRQAVIYKGRSRDTAWYAVTDKEWPTVREAFQGWLGAANFTTEGRQRRPLQAFRNPSPMLPGAM